MLAAIEFSSLSGGYNGTDVIKNIRGLIRHGKVTALIGPNGCGKSTLIKMLCGVLPCEGVLKLSGRPFKSYSRRELGKLIGVVPQHTRFAGEFTVCDVIGFGRLPYSGLFSSLSAEDERVILESARSVGIESLLFREIYSLSGGEKQRVAAAMVLAQNPAVFLLDEPSSSLDPPHSVRLFRLLRGLAGEGKTVVAAVHDVNAALAYSDDYIAIKGGEIIASGHSGAIDAEILEAVYGTKFYDYRSKTGDISWQPYSKR